MPEAPQHVHWTDHAYVKAGVLGVTRADIEQAIVEHHHDRQSNPGAARWRLSMGPWVILYDHPDEQDQSTARIVTLWRRR